MGKFTRRLLVLVSSVTVMANSHPALAQRRAPSLPVSADTLAADTTGLVSLIYFQKARSLSTASTASVKGTEFAHTPVGPYPIALAGRLPGLSISQSSGQPLNEGFGITLRNQSPLVLVDGIPRALTEIGMEEIESVTVLKDAVATAMLGVRGSGGALLVTTKKGQALKQSINFNVQTGVAKPLQNSVSAPLDAYRYAQLYNEALANDGLPVAAYGFSPEALEGFRTGSDGAKYPDVDWKNEVLNRSAFFARYNVNTQGGNNFVKYFVSVEHINQEGLLKTSDSNKYNTNASLKGYFARSNADLKLTNHLSAGIYIQGRILNTTSPGDDGTEGLFSSLLTTPRNASPIYNSNGSYAGTAPFPANIVARNIGSGYSLSNTRTVLSDFYLKGNLDQLTQGLWVKARASFFSNLNENIRRSKSVAVFEQTGVSSTGEPTYRQYGTNSSQSNANAISFQNRSDFQELSAGYARGFGPHEVEATVLANRDNLVNGSNLPYTIQGISGHAAYHFNKKYLAEISVAYNGANRYPHEGGFKYGWFPAVGLGWNLKEEALIQGISWLDRLKLYGSYGKTGRDNAYYYTYQQVYNASPTAIFGSSAAAATTVGESFLANPNITWEKAKKLNAGLEGSLFRNQLSFGLEYYFDRYSDLSIIRGTNSGLLGISFPSENIGRERYSGWEAQLGWKQQKKKIGYSIALNSALQQSELLFSAEGQQQYDWMKRTGQPVDRRFGYVAEGLFQDQQEIASAPTIEGYQPQPGDIRYRDLNNDGIINQYDQTAIGKGKPFLLLGASLGLQAYGFDLSVLLQGCAHRELYLSGDSFWEFQNSGKGQAFGHQLDRWTPATAATATYPRLTTGLGPNDGSSNNWVTSSYWLRKGDYLRVRSAELGYAVPAVYSRKLGISLARFYVNAFNPLTFASKELNGADPENYSGNYPLQQVYTAGVQIQL
ncbi:SusC/RagA family TonB-linked outer membrane protein [Paraflavisolibacter sp. H34]|uniref:SusC/RagA family TonB-linked outer membrane protein n=1 Tax=Huijunlia imazamoxiresistens TaxID=3127457 RepID=UPI00301B35C5